MKRSKLNKNKIFEVEVLNFRRAEEIATVVTNGKISRAYTNSATKKFAKISQAIAFLEARGFDIAIQ